MTFREVAPDGSTIISGGNAPIAADSLLLPPNLRGGRKEAILDLNTAPEACQPGFWAAMPGSTNVPPNGAGTYYYGWTIIHDNLNPGSTGTWLTQYAQSFSGGPTIYQHAQTWFRRKTSGGWQPWRTLEVLPILHNQAWTFRLTNAPNDSAERTVHPIHNYGIPPQNAIWAQVNCSISANCFSNAQATWQLHLKIGDAANNWKRFGFTVHNHGNAYFDMGRDWSYNIDVRPHVARGHTFDIALNCANDSGSGAWLDIGAFHTEVTFMGHSEGVYMYG